MCFQFIVIVGGTVCGFSSFFYWWWDFDSVQYFIAIVGVFAEVFSSL